MRECMDRYGGLVWALARRLSPTPSDADDAVQEIFIDLWKSAARFDPSVASESTFVAMIARRRLIDRGRRRSRRLDNAALPESPPAAEEPPVGRSTEVAEASRLAQEAFEQLRPEQRRVLQLAIFRGTSHEEIARSTGLPLGTVKTHARRGLIRLRELLAQQGVVDPSGEGGSSPPGPAGTPSK
ncbi:MAG: sigma-70 family RNA polymerase sigma factor [Phycisphaerales bacterium]